MTRFLAGEMVCRPRPVASRKPGAGLPIEQRFNLCDRNDLPRRMDTFRVMA